MPVFHTKTIESILDPVAQQVSRLVILHEEAEDGNAMPDLAVPVKTVKAAVDNLVAVGYDTVNNSDDQILKQDMPPALRRVEESSILLLDVTELLLGDPFSGPARNSLIEGARGILQGTSALLLAFDESEVRKIIRVCKTVLEYLAITEVVDLMEDLVTFVKNLSPVLTRMTKSVDAREKELTHQIHRDMLTQSLEQVKVLTPILISSIKMFIAAKESGCGCLEAQKNRDFTVCKMSDEIHEIIRVLQLTTYDEVEWDADDLTVMKRAQNAIQGKLQAANDWLQDPAALVGSAGDKALRQILDDAVKIADRSTDRQQAEAICKSVGNMRTMVDTLSELRQQGKGSSPQATSLFGEIRKKLRELPNTTANAISSTESSGVLKPTPTVDGKVEQARQWLTNPFIDDKGLGEASSHLVVDEGRRVASFLTGPQRQELLRLCDETEILTNQLSDVMRNGQGHMPQTRIIAQNLSDKLSALKVKIQDALVNQVAEDFIDTSMCLKQLSEAAIVPKGVEGREANFNRKADDFNVNARRLANTANSVAMAGGCQNKRTVEAIFKTSSQVMDLTPEVENAARVLFNNPQNQAVLEHFELLKNQWTDRMDHLRCLVDEAIDTNAFIRAEEQGILRDTDRVEEGIKMSNPEIIVLNGAQIARRSNRILQVADMELQNSEDASFVGRVNSATECLKSSIPPMVQTAKSLSASPQNPAAVTNWRNSIKQVSLPVTTMSFSSPTSVPQLPLCVRHTVLASTVFLINDVGAVGVAVGVKREGYSDCFPIQSDMQQLHISVKEVCDDSYHRPTPGTVSDYVPWNMKSDHASLHLAPPPTFSPPVDQHKYYDYEGGTPPRPPPPTAGLAPPRPPPPETDDDEDFPSPQANQPIMMAAHALHMESKQWSSKDNEIIGATKRMALLMAKLSQLVRGEGGSKKDLISTAKGIAEASVEVTRLAKRLAAECTDRKMRNNLLSVCERIPTIGTQLKILSTVKATMLGAQGSEEDQEATEMLVGNAQNLMQAVKETVRSAEAASIKMRVDSGYTIRWMRRRPWYT